jgi:hypothetical protein
MALTKSCRTAFHASVPSIATKNNERENWDGASLGGENRASLVRVVAEVMRECLGGTAIRLQRYALSIAFGSSRDADMQIVQAQI